VINIAIIDRNRTFRESLKTLLEQIKNFRVVLDCDDNSCPENPGNDPVHVMLIDSSIGKEKCAFLMNETLAQWESVKTIILAMYKDELNLDSGKAEVMQKSSSKKEFENRIKKLITG
jgi:DNA-binding NarL/FixJ family response regulator